MSDKLPAKMKPVDEVRNTITKMEPQFQAALPKHISTEKFMRVVMTAVSSDPKILNADRHSLYAECMKAAADGLLLDKKEAALVPFGNTLVYTPMINGILKKLRNSGELSSITSQIVYEKDEFQYWVDSDGEHLNHRPLFFGARGKPIGVYAFAKTKDGGIYIEPMSVEDVMKVKNASKSKSGPWYGPFELEMWRKTALKKLCKRMPSSTDLDITLSRDDELLDLKDVSEPVSVTTEATAPSPRKKKSRLETVVESKAESDELPPEPPSDEEYFGNQQMDADGIPL